jgi:hypothetical protein
MHFGPIGNRRIQAPHPKQDCTAALSLGDDMRPALRAEIPLLAGRGLKAPEQAFTSGPAKLIAGNVGHRGEGRPMRLSACGAVAVNDGSGLGIYFVGHVSAQAASSEHGASLDCPLQRRTVLPIERTVQRDLISGRFFRSSEGAERLCARLLALFDIDVVAAGDAGIELPRPADLLLRVLDHLAPLADPADGARDRKQHGEHRGREAHRL